MARYKWQDSEYGKIAGYGIKRPDPVGLSQLQKTQLKPYEEQIKGLGTEEEKRAFTRSILDDTTQRTHAYQQASSDMVQALAITRPETQMDRYDRLTQEWTKRGRGSLPLTPGTGLQMFNDEIERLLIEVSDDWYTKVKPYHGEYMAGPGKWELASESFKALTAIASPAIGVGEYGGEIIGGEIGELIGGEKGRATGQDWGEIIGGIGGATSLVRKGIPGAIRAFAGLTDEATALANPSARALTADGGFRQVGLTAIDELESRKESLVRAGKTIGTWKTWLNNEEVVIGNDATTNKFILGLHKAKVAVRKQAAQYKKERAGISAQLDHYEGELVRAYDDIEHAFRRGASELEIDGYKAKINKITEQQRQSLKGEFKRIGMDLPDHLLMDEPEIFHMMDRISAAGPRGLTKKAIGKVTGGVKPVYGSKALVQGETVGAGRKHTIKELREAGDEGSIKLDDLGIKLEDSGLSVERQGNFPLDSPIAGTPSAGRSTKSVAEMRRADLEQILSTDPNKSTAAAGKRIADSLEEGIDPQTGDDIGSFGTFADYIEFDDSGRLANTVEDILGRNVKDTELMSDLAPKIRAGSEELIADAQKNLRKLDLLDDEIEAFRIQRGINRIGTNERTEMQFYADEMLERQGSTLPKTFTDPTEVPTPIYSGYGEQGIRTPRAIGSTETLLDWRDPANVSTKNMLDTFEVGNARAAYLRMMVGNRVPTKYEQKLLAKALGPGVEEALNTWRSTPERIRQSLFEIAGAPISILSSMDMSAPLFQGMFLVTRNIRDRQTYGAFKDMAKAAFSERHARDLQRALYNKPNFTKFKRNGLFINEGSLGAKEEAFISSLPQRIPGIGKLIRGSERAYSTFLNQMRYHYVNKVYTSWQKSALKGARAPGEIPFNKIVPITTEGLDAAEISARTTRAGKYIGDDVYIANTAGDIRIGRNEALLEEFTIGTLDDDLRNLVKLANFATGRGTGLGNETLNQVGSIAFYAPRLATSRFNLIGQGTKNIVAGSDNVRKESAKLLVSGFGSMMAVMGGIEMGSRGWAKATGKEKPFSVELNPQSTDFAKIRMGSTRLDLSAGYSQVFRFVAQLATEQRKTTGTGAEMPQEWQTTVGRFLRSKFSPAMGTAWDVGEGQTFLGEELETTPSGLSEEALRRLTPLFIQDVYDILETEGMTPQGAAQLGIGAPAAFLGVRSTTYRSTADIANKYLKEDIVLTDENGERIYDVKDERLTPAQKAQIFNDRRIQAEAQELNRSTKEDFMMQMASLSENAQIARDQRFLDPSRSNPMPASEWREALTIASVQDAAYREVRKIYEGDIQRDQKFGGIVGVVMDIINKNEVERTSEEQSLADYYSLLDEYTLNPEQLDQLFGENFSAKSASDQELLLRGRSGFDMEGLIAARDQFISRLGRKERDFVLNNIHPNRTPLQDAYYKAQKSLSNYWDIPEKIAGRNEALFALWKQFDSLPPNEKRIYAVQNPGVIRLDRMISLERMKMRRKNISIDENLVAFYDASPMHKDLIREGRGGRNNLLIKTRVLSGIDRRLDESLNLRRLQRK